MSTTIGVDEHRWARPVGTTLLGEVAGSGLKAPAFLVRRPDGQVVQVSALVNTVLARLDPRRTPAQVADAVSVSYGRTLTVEGLDLLVSVKLAPVGLADDAAHDAGAGARGRARKAPTANPLLSLTMRGTLVPAGVVRRLARVLAPTFRPVVVALVLAAWVAVDVMILADAQVIDALAVVLQTPVVMVGIFALTTLCALVHELGHAAACSYGGATPGRIGVGVYLVAPAFFTNVTDSYRLGRGGRLRTDLGGLYFTVWCLLAVGTAQLVTDSPVLLVVLVLMHVEAFEQLLPAVRLDGYFVLTDLAGVPDLFARIGPVLRSVVPGRPVDPRVADMRPGARRAVTAWVLCVVPLLAAGVVWLVLNLPALTSTAVDAVTHQWSLLSAAWSAHDVAAVLVGIVSLALLAVPVAGLAALAVRTLQSGAALGRRLLTARRPRRQIMDSTLTPGTAPGAHAAPAAGPGDVPDLPASAQGFDLLAALSRSASVLQAPAPWAPAAPGLSAAAPGLNAVAGLEIPRYVPEPEPELVRGPDPAPAAGKPAAEPPAGEAAEPPAGEAAEPPAADVFDPTRLSGLTAAELTDETVLGAPRRLATTGWRKAVRTGTHGAVALGPGRSEVRRDTLHDRVRAPIDGTRRVVVMSRKGGVGKTSVTVGLGATFATLRGDRVVAVDANPDAGNLANRIAGDCDRTITDLIHDAGAVDSFATMRRYTSQCPESRLEVLASDDDARITQALDRAAYRKVVGVLDHFYNLVLLDTGTGILDSANQGLLAEADELVLVLRPALDGARAGAQTLDWLEEHGYPELVRTAVVVLNGVTEAADPAVHVIRDHFAQRCAHVVVVPWDKTLQAGGHTTLAALQPRTREAFMEVAAALADSFHTSPRAVR
ncbi:MinD/ParA family ATP-binding protein [Xylanimonas protaetiae]|uniref:MinD/ParA family protein n=1 Tax=Xylanimonas protaetiae TaxID=2509457 RepID=A0A4P6F025_9MICO|nr:MinD/ParA family protein [Xylanimonas protaetiae]QAY69080.1 MinD/ParA family protein [Xylanimonas protaetiae]